MIQNLIDFRRIAIGVAVNAAVVFGAHAQSAPVWTYDVPNQAAEQAT